MQLVMNTADLAEALSMSEKTIKRSRARNLISFPHV
jgi:hypothetical protein